MGNRRKHSQGYKERFEAKVHGQREARYTRVTSFVWLFFVMFGIPGSLVPYHFFVLVGIARLLFFDLEIRLAESIKHHFG